MHACLYTYTENSVALTVEGNTTVKTMDNSKSFNKVKTNVAK